MKIKITLIFLCGFFQIVFSQNIKGKVMANNLPISNVEVINMSSKEVVNTNTDGFFEMNASVGNWITFYHKNYDVMKVYVDSAFNFKDSLEIRLAEKSIQIEEVVVNKNGFSFGKIDFESPIINTDKPSPQFNDGSIPNGVDFVAIFKKIKKAIEKNKEKAKPKVIVEFRAFTSLSYTNEFFANSLKLKSEDVEEFLNFCSFDPKSSEAVENSDKLTLLQFLMAKSEEYKKVYQKE